MVARLSIVAVGGIDTMFDVSGEFGDPGYRKSVVEVSEEMGKLGDPGCENPVDKVSEDRGELGEPG